VDVLDDLLKSYVQKICADSADMITLLEQQLANEPHAVADSTSAAEALSAQIAEEKEALKIMMRQKVRDL
jgi:dsDNA-binding SOS-regulon protein